MRKMPVKRGRFNSEFSYNEQILKVIEHYPGTNFVIGNAQADGIPVIYCTRGICELTGYEKGDFVQKSCALEFLCGPETDPISVSDVRKALQCEEKREIYPVTYYKKDDGRLFALNGLKKETDKLVMLYNNYDESTTVIAGHILPENLWLKNFKILKTAETFPASYMIAFNQQSEPKNN